MKSKIIILMTSLFFDKKTVPTQWITLNLCFFFVMFLINIHAIKKIWMTCHNTLTVFRRLLQKYKIFFLLPEDEGIPHRKDTVQRNPSALSESYSYFRYVNVHTFKATSSNGFRESCVRYNQSAAKCPFRFAERFIKYGESQQELST